jgi:DNA-binding PadR family transcriptional regulator
VRSSWDDDTGRQRKWYELTPRGNKKLNNDARDWADYAACIRQLLAAAKIRLAAT